MRCRCVIGAFTDVLGAVLVIKSLRADVDIKCEPSLTVESSYEVITSQPLTNNSVTLWANKRLYCIKTDLTSY